MAQIQRRTRQMKMNWRHVVVGMFVAIHCSGQVPPCRPRPRPPPPLILRGAEFGIGWDNSISGNINSSGIGRINDQAVVITKNSYEDVYGTGLHLRFGGGYMLNESSEVRATFTFQSLDADLTPMGDIGVSNLYGQYADYQSFGLDIGLRRYHTVSAVRTYGEGTIGIGFIDETDVILVAPQANVATNATDFYDRTAAFTVGANVGLLFQAQSRFGFFGQMGLRWVSGMAAIDGLGYRSRKPSTTRARAGRCCSSLVFGRGSN
jgi:hypothetical protein